MRRLGERPANVGFVLRGIFKRPLRTGDIRRGRPLHFPRTAAADARSTPHPPRGPSARQSRLTVSAQLYTSGYGPAWHTSWILLSAKRNGRRGVLGSSSRKGAGDGQRHGDALPERRRAAASRPRQRRRCPAGDGHARRPDPAAVCGLHGHDPMLQFEQGRMFLRCTSCGYAVPGLGHGRAAAQAAFRGRRRRHQLHGSPAPRTRSLA